MKCNSCRGRKVLCLLRSNIGEDLAVERRALSRMAAAERW